MQHLIWSVTPLCAPHLARHCPKCGQSEYENSGCFRVNANGCRLDVWLIYKCVSCQSTLNLTVFARIAAKSLPPDQLRGFTDNDGDLALKMGLDAGFLARNRVEAIPESVRYSVSGARPEPGVPTRVSVRCESPMDIKALRAISEKLEISQSALRRMAEAGFMEVEGDLKKLRLTREFTFAVTMPE